MIEITIFIHVIHACHSNFVDSRIKSNCVNPVATLESN